MHDNINPVLIIGVLAIIGLVLWLNSSKPKKRRCEEDVAHAQLKWAKVKYWRDRHGCRARVHFAHDLSEVSAIHIHREKKGGGVGPIIAWLATSADWHNGPIQANKNSNTPCCNSGNCALQAPPTTPLVHNMAGKILEMRVPYHGLGKDCEAERHLRHRNVFLVVHGKKLTKKNPLDILGHQKFQ